jgi:hypothetical protein
MKHPASVLALSLSFCWYCRAQSQQPPQFPENSPASLPNSTASLSTPPMPASCAPEVLQAASSSARQLADTHFMATERVEHSELDKHGNPYSTKAARFAYFAEIQDLAADKAVKVTEYRDGSGGVEGFPTEVAAKGLPAYALIFHPTYIGDFSMVCEGVTQMQGQAAWQVRFTQQRTNKFRGYRVNDRFHPVKLQGRAWIAVESGHFLRLESELLEPIPKIHLKQDHVSIDYRPVEFRNENVQLWLPEIAEVTITFGGHSFRQRHAFSDFVLYSVHTTEKFQGPKLVPKP